MKKIFIRFLKEHNAYQRYFKYYNKNEVKRPFETVINNNPTRMIVRVDIFTYWYETEEGDTYWRVLHMLWMLKLYQLHHITKDDLINNWSNHMVRPIDEYQRNLITVIKNSINNNVKK